MSVLLLTLLAGTAQASTAPSASTALPARTSTVVASDAAEEPQDCEQLVPSSQLVEKAVIPPTAPLIRLNVLVLTEAQDLKKAQDAFVVARRVYAPLRITLAARFRVVPRIPNLRDDATAYLAWLKTSVGGQRPAGVDAVYLATSRQLDTGGKADCIGGVASTTRAFAVGQLDFAGAVAVQIVGGPSAPDGPPIPDGGAKIAAHELGHLLGAQHHYGGDCVPQPSDATHPCDLMLSASAQTIGLRFGALNAAVVRDQAVRFVSP